MEELFYSSDTSFADPDGLAIVFVGWRPVAGGGYHMYIFIVDEETGQSWTVSGGPGPGGALSGGPIKNNSGPFSLVGGARAGNNYEAENDLKNPFKNGSIVIDDKKSGQYWYDKLSSIGGEIQAEKHEYQTFGENSNSFVSTVLLRGGIFDDWLKTPGSYAVSDIPDRKKTWVPGYGKFMDRKRKKRSSAW